MYKAILRKRLRLDLAAVHVDDIADRVKFVEADADRKDNSHQRQAGSDAAIGGRRGDV
jgi:hypothetical protein